MKKGNISTDILTPVFEKIGELTKVQRVIICAAAFLIMIGGFTYFSYYPKHKEIDRLETKYRKLRSDLTTAKKNASQLKKFQEEMKAAEDSYKIASRALPETKEIPSLLADVSKSGKESGLDFLLFQPKPDKEIDFYAEIPVYMEFKGGYHNVALFFDQVSRLYRIVNIKDITIDNSKNDEKLTTKCTAVTYRFLEREIKPKP
jgi:type IV pilus assembly protein PilO